MIVRNDIKESLKSAGKSSADLAREIDLNYETLNRYLNGRSKMPAAVEGKVKEQILRWNGQ